MANGATSRKTGTITKHPGTRIAPMRARVQEAVSIAEDKGLLGGGRTLMIRGRMPEALVSQAKRKTGIASDSKLLEAALASLAVADDYAELLIARRGTVSADLDLEF